VIMKWFLRKRNGGHGMNCVAEERDRRWDLVNAVMKLRVP
jgi:hypothetical protein